jgi:uncharacterized tellurite resistance protein B-like protein
MRSLRRLLGIGSDVAGEVRDTETVRRIAAELDALPAAEARYLAAFSYVLARVARADLEISPEETEQMTRLVREWSTLGEAQALLVVQLAKTQAVALGGTENYLVTRQFKELSDRAQRVDLLRCMFAVAAADRNISSIENAEITAIAIELDFTDAEIASIRAGYREQLAVLKDRPD